MLANGVCWHQILSQLALTGCWKELLTQTWMECQLFRTYFRYGFCRWCRSTCWATWTSHLVPALETMASKAASLWLKMNCQKTKVQALDSNHSLGQEVAMVEDFVYLGSVSKLSWYLMSQCHYSSTKLKLYIILAFYQSSCMAHEQLPREIYSRLMISIKGVCESC